MSACELFAVEDGRPSGETVVFAGSLGSTHAMWEPQLAAVADRFRVIRFDARGHGRSPVPPGPYSIDDLADDLLSLLDRIGVEQAHIVGLSLGGMTGMRLAARNPERVTTLTVISSSAQLGPATIWSDRAAAVLANGTPSIARMVVSRWLTPEYAERNPGELADLEAMLCSTPRHGYAACCGAIERMDLRADLATITAPTLAIAGADDPATPPAHLRLIADTVPGARYAEIPHAAHLASWERPAAVNELVLTQLVVPEGDAEDDRLRQP